MKSMRKLLTTGSQIFPVDYRAGDCTINVTPTASTYTAEFTVNNVWDTSITPRWAPITDMTAATTAQTKGIEAPITAVRVTVNAGASVEVNLVQGSV